MFCLAGEPAADGGRQPADADGAQQQRDDGGDGAAGAVAERPPAGAADRPVSQIAPVASRRQPGLFKRDPRHDAMQASVSGHYSLMFGRPCLCSLSIDDRLEHSDICGGPAVAWLHHRPSASLSEPSCLCEGVPAGFDCRAEGVLGLYRGFNASVMMFVPSSAIWWGSYGGCAPAPALAANHDTSPSRENPSHSRLRVPNHFQLSVERKLIPPSTGLLISAIIARDLARSLFACHVARSQGGWRFASRLMRRCPCLSRYQKVIWQQLEGAAEADEHRPRPAAQVR